MKQNLVFDAGAPALAEMATDQRKQADPYASDYKLGAKELSFTTPALYTTMFWSSPASVPAQARQARLFQGSPWSSDLQTIGQEGVSF